MSNIQELVEKELIDNYQKYYRIAFTYTKNEEDALDAVQEGAYKAVKNASRIRESEFIGTWICKIIINESIEILRKNKKVVPLIEGVEEGKDDNYEDMDLKRAIEKLEIIDQTIIRLRYFLDMPLKEIAKVVDSNENTVKSRLYRSLDKLKLNLEAV